MTRESRVGRRRGGSLLRHVRRSGVLVATVALLALTATPVAAAAPDNDLPVGATVVDTSALPQVFDQDTTEATVTTDDVGCGAGGVDAASVWYQITPSEDVFLLVSAVGSDYLVGINLFAGTAESDGLIDCGDVFIGLAAQAGTTYYVMLADVEGEAPLGGSLHLEVSLLPPPIELSLTVEPAGSVDTRTGLATLRGTVSCNVPDASAEITVVLTQTSGRFTIHGAGQSETLCTDTPTPWSVEVNGDNGKFGGGKVSAVVEAFACDPFSCGDTGVTIAARLRR
jgi:hypothetical protein